MFDLSTVFQLLVDKTFCFLSSVLPSIDGHTTLLFTAKIIFHNDDHKISRQSFSSTSATSH